MSRKIHASFLALVMITAFALTGAQSVRIAAAAPVASNDLLGMLPPSDIIAYVDTQRVLTDVIPTIFADQPEVRTKLETDLDRFKQEVGVDPRTIDAVAVGVNLDSSRQARGFDFALIARGRFDANAAIEAGLAAALKQSKGELEKRTRQYEGRTIYVLTPSRKATTQISINIEPPLFPDNRPIPYDLKQQKAMSASSASSTSSEKASPPKAAQTSLEQSQTKSDGVVAGESDISSNTMVFVALDSNTVAFGNLKSVQATIDASMGREKVSDELVQLATRTPNAVASFSGNITPKIAGNFLGIGNKKTDDSIASIKQVYGSFNLSGNDGESLVNIRTETAEQSRQLGSTLNGLKLMAKLAGTAAPTGERRSLETLINSLTIYAVDNEVQLTFKFAAKDLKPFARNF